MNVEFKNGQLVLTWPGDDDSTVIAKDVGGKYAVHVSDAGDVPEPWEESPYTASSAERSHHTPEGVRVFARRVLHHAPNGAARRR